MNHSWEIFTKKPSHIPWTQSFQTASQPLNWPTDLFVTHNWEFPPCPMNFRLFAASERFWKSQFDQKKRRNNFFPRAFVNLNLIQKNYLSPFCSTKSWWKIGKSYSHGLVLALTSCRSNSACLAAHSWTFGAKKTRFLSAAHRSKV